MGPLLEISEEVRMPSEEVRMTSEEVRLPPINGDSSRPNSHNTPHTPPDNNNKRTFKSSPDTTDKRRTAGSGATGSRRANSTSGPSKSNPMTLQQMRHKYPNGVYHDSGYYFIPSLNGYVVVNPSTGLPDDVTDTFKPVMDQYLSDKNLETNFTLYNDNGIKTRKPFVFPSYPSQDYGHLRNLGFSSTKTIAVERQDWPHSYYRYHLNDGYCVMDQSQTVIDSRDERYKTEFGYYLKSSGKVKFSFLDRQEIQLDAEDVLRILQDKPPRGIYRQWNMMQIDDQFRNRFGRNGIWHKRKLELNVFLSCFENTFHVFGDKHQYVRARQNNGKMKVKMDRVMINLARIQNPALVQYQKDCMLNLTALKGIEVEGVSDHKMLVNHKLNYDIPTGKCFMSEEEEKFKIRQEPHVREEIFHSN